MLGSTPAAPALSRHAVHTWPLSLSPVVGSNNSNSNNDNTFYSKVLVRPVGCSHHKIGWRRERSHHTTLPQRAWLRLTP